MASIVALLDADPVALLATDGDVLDEVNEADALAESAAFLLALLAALLALADVLLAVDVAEAVAPPLLGVLRLAVLLPVALFVVATEVDVLVLAEVVRVDVVVLLVVVDVLVVRLLVVGLLVVGFDVVVGLLATAGFGGTTLGFTPAPNVQASTDPGAGV